MVEFDEEEQFKEVVQVSLDELYKSDEMMLHDFG